MAYAQLHTSVSRPSTGVHVALWIVQGVLGALFAFAGATKMFQSIPDLAASMPWIATVSPALVRFIGVAELLGGIGLILPAATRIAPGLTPVAGAGLTVVMLLASAFHVSRGELMALPVPIVFGALASFVAWGRSTTARIGGR